MRAKSYRDSRECDHQHMLVGLPFEPKPDMSTSMPRPSSKTVLVGFPQNIRLALDHAAQV